MLLESFDLTIEGIQVHLKLYDPVTVLFDVSGAGKSFICSGVHNYILNHPNCHYNLLMPESFSLWRAMLGQADTLLFIDDIDLLAELYPESIDYINSGEIPMVVTGRDFSKFKFDYHAYQRLLFDANKKILTNDPSYLA